MAVLIDEPNWWYRGRRWCHLVSDSSYEELHEFVDVLGVPRHAFQGDHYDLPEDHRDRALAAGAAPVSSREVVLRLRAAGLLLTSPQRRAVVAALRPS